MPSKTIVGRALTISPSPEPGDPGRQADRRRQTPTKYPPATHPNNAPVTYGGKSCNPFGTGKAYLRPKSASRSG
jgi:hypothetical protein